MSKNIYLDVGQYNEDKKFIQKQIEVLMNQFAEKYNDTVFIRQVSVARLAYNDFLVTILDKILET